MVGRSGSLPWYGIGADGARRVRIVDYSTLETGCYIDGHWGQYGIDRLVELFGTEAECALVAGWRAEMESESYDPMLSSAFERRADLADEVEARLNAGLPEGLRAHWYEGEFFVSVDCGADAWSGESCEFCDDDSCACFCHCD